jgi:hypothetical protein
VPTHLHEILIEIFRERPSLVADLLGGQIRMALPAFDEARLSSGELTDIAATEYRADAVVTLHNEGGQPVLAVVVEVQLRTDPQKLRSWVSYVATLYARLGCRVALLVVCPKQSVADWSALPITFGPPGSVLTPVAIGPDHIPRVTDPLEARRTPELAVLSALAHGGDPNPAPVLNALVEGLHVVDLEHFELYTDFLRAVLPAAARDCLEEFMPIAGYQLQSDFARRQIREGEARGEARGEAKALLMILDARGVSVPEEVRARIAECTDLDRLASWVRRAATAEKIGDLDESFAG